MSGRSRSRSRTRKLKVMEPLHEEEDLLPIIIQSYELALGTYKGSIEKGTIKDIIKTHMEESVIMSLGKHTPYNGETISEAINTFLENHDVHKNMIQSRYKSLIFPKKYKSSRGGSNKRKTRRRLRA